MPEKEKLLEVLTDYINQIDSLKEKNHGEGASDKELLHEKIRSFIRRVFPDSDTRLREFEGIHLMVPGIDRTEEEEEEWDQWDYLMDLNSWKKHLLAYKEELEIFGTDFKPSGPSKTETTVKGGFPFLNVERKTTKEK
jgi:hypothetical protein